MNPQTIRLVTWNIRWGRGIDNTVDLDRTLRHLRQFSGFDILCMQEISSGWRDPELKHADGTNQFEALASRFKDYTPVCGYAVEQPGSGGITKRFGNMLLSRFPVLQVYRHRLPQPAGAEEKGMARMALEALIQTPAGLFCIITTHLEYHSASHRIAQVDYLRGICRNAWAHSLSASRTAAKGPFAPYPPISGIILAGDFNFPETAAEKTQLLAPLGQPGTPPLADAWEICHPHQKHAPTMGYFDRKRWPGGPFVSDYIFISQNLAPRVRDMRVETTSAASDHQALLMELDASPS
ncbi:MAG: endonuclease/exonuclease/phosphatase family protein [Alistipes senegalensis]|nr:endonuclease/exonuclease/phosphatase family protein [Oxalobacter formigenes]MCM1280707.1 endonuclease/exonuclease/phosphatase family protein [Alistipes senegalensis]